MPLPLGIVTGLIELGKLGLQAWFQANRLAGKTEDEIDALYNAEKKEFQANNPDNLPDVPPDDENTGTEGEIADAGPDTP